LERDLDRVSDDFQIEFGTLKTRLEMQTVKNNDLQHQLAREKEHAEEIYRRMQAQTQEIIDVESQIASMVSTKKEFDQ
jgi:hypothetical protein